MLISRNSMSEISSHALTTVSRKQTLFETALPCIINACGFRLIFSEVFITERPPLVHGVVFSCVKIRSGAPATMTSW